MLITEFILYQNMVIVAVVMVMFTMIDLSCIELHNSQTFECIIISRNHDDVIVKRITNMDFFI